MFPQKCEDLAPPFIQFEHEQILSQKGQILTKPNTSSHKFRPVCLVARKMPRPFAVVPPQAQVQPEPYTLRVYYHEIQDFKTLLKASKIGPETYENLHPNGGFGISRQWLSDAKDAWLNTFDWSIHEERINSFPNFMMRVHDSECGDFDIHFAALFSSRKEAIPIIFMHGWPGSFMEFLPILELLSKKYTPDTLPYHVIVPSSPGYAMSSGPPVDKDFTLLDVARVLNQLMVNLGFENGYIAQGGDIGSMLARIMSFQHKECKAFHSEWPDLKLMIRL